MSTSICSFNVRGLRNKTKRDQMFHWLKQKSYSISLLQETHLTVKDEHIWKKEWVDHVILVVKAQVKRESLY